MRDIFLEIILFGIVIRVLLTLWNELETVLLYMLKKFVWDCYYFVLKCWIKYTSEAVGPTNCGQISNHKVDLKKWSRTSNFQFLCQFLQSLFFKEFIHLILVIRLIGTKLFIISCYYLTFFPVKTLVMSLFHLWYWWFLFFFFFGGVSLFFF